jgi:hypothetical protein
LLALTAVGCATITPVAPTNPAADVPTLSPPDTPEFIPTALPVTATSEGCAYMWGSEDMPDLSRKFNAELQKISTDAGGLAYAYGENCVYGDGHQTFGAMETDFRVGVQVKSIKDEAALGNWISKIMQIVDQLPPSDLQGPQPGRVDFDFKQPDPAELFVTVPIDKYRTEGRSLKGIELFRLFYTGP